MGFMSSKHAREEMDQAQTVRAYNAYYGSYESEYARPVKGYGPRITHGGSYDHGALGGRNRGCTYDRRAVQSNFY
jgi:hypothetical protein